MVCVIVFCSEFPNIPDNAGRKMRRRTQPIAKLYAFHENAINLFVFVKIYVANTSFKVRSNHQRCSIKKAVFRKIVKFTVITVTAIFNLTDSCH